MTTHKNVLLIPCALGVICFAVLLTGIGCNRSHQTASNLSTAQDWKQVEGVWTATGNRHTVRLNGERKASIATYNGSLVLAGEGRPGVGFRSEAIVFSDTETGMVGRAIWTDERGDQVFSELHRTVQPGENILNGKVVGGTGRYAGASGEYEFGWRFLIENEAGEVQGQSVGLKGRIRIPNQQASYSVGGHQ